MLEVEIPASIRVEEISWDRGAIAYLCSFSQSSDTRLSVNRLLLLGRIWWSSELMNILSSKKANLTILYPVARTSTLVLINPDICTDWFRNPPSCQQSAIFRHIEIGFARVAEDGCLVVAASVTINLRVFSEAILSTCRNNNYRSGFGGLCNFWGVVTK
jgi:hypothetical protein